MPAPSNASSNISTTAPPIWAIPCGASRSVTISAGPASMPRSPCCAGRPFRSAPLRRCPRRAVSSPAAQRVPRCWWCGTTRESCAPSSMPAATGACRWPVAKAAARPSPALTMPGPMAWMAGCGVFPARTPFPTSTRQPMAWCPSAPGRLGGLSTSSNRVTSTPRSWPVPGTTLPPDRPTSRTAK